MDLGKEFPLKYMVAARVDLLLPELNRWVCGCLEGYLCGELGRKDWWHVAIDLLDERFVSREDKSVLKDKATLKERSEAMDLSIAFSLRISNSVSFEKHRDIKGNPLPNIPFDLLKSVKNIRNLYCHRGVLDFTYDEAQVYMKSVCDLASALGSDESGPIESFRNRCLRYASSRLDPQPPDSNQGAHPKMVCDDLSSSVIGKVGSLMNNPGIDADILAPGSSYIDTFLAQYAQIAENGDTEAQYNLGMMYVEGILVIPDVLKGVYWLLKASDNGCVQAFCRLGDTYRYGNGVRRDLMSAWNYYRLGADLGDPEAERNLMELSKLDEVRESLDRVLGHTQHNMCCLRNAPAYSESLVHFRFTTPCEPEQVLYDCANLYGYLFADPEASLNKMGSWIENLELFAHALCDNTVAKADSEVKQLRKNLKECSIRGIHPEELAKAILRSPPAEILVCDDDYRRQGIVYPSGKHSTGGFVRAGKSIMKWVRSGGYSPDRANHRSQVIQSVKTQ